MIPFIILLIILGWVLIILGFNYKEYIFAALGAIFFMALGIYIALNGITDVNNLATQTLAVVHIAVGAYVLLRGSFELYKDM